jgi:predicted DNA-binding protein with PD1-like motif
MKTLLRSIAGGALRPFETGPSGRPRGAQHRLTASHADGSKDYVLVLARGDEVATALADFAQSEDIAGAHFTAAGAVRDPDVAWFDLSRRQYRAKSFSEQMEVLTLAGDLGRGEDRKTVIHTHVVLGRNDGRAFGGHLIRATVSPRLEVLLTSYPEPIRRRTEAKTDLKVFDLVATHR